MKITIIGAGGGGPGCLTGAAQQALEEADLYIGAERLLAALPATYAAPRRAAVAAEEIVALIAAQPQHSRICVLMSGDPGFYSGAARLLPGLQGHEVEILPGVSSMQLLAARLQRSWQDWRLISAHGRDCQAAALVRDHEQTFFLTGGAQSAAAVCRDLCDAGVGDCRATVGENLGAANERLISGTVAGLAEQSFAPLSVLLVDNPAPRLFASCGLADAEFLRGETPMTKSEIRAVILSKLRLRRHDIVFDVGAGSGSVAVEAALLVADGAVYAIEREEAGCRLIEQNTRRLAATNVRVIAGEAPAALAGLPAPNAAFIGGSGGRLREIVQELLRLNPGLRLVISAVTLETLAEAGACLAELAFTQVEIVQVAVSRAKEVGAYHLLAAQNPVFIISGVGKHD